MADPRKSMDSAANDPEDALLGGARKTQVRTAKKDRWVKFGLGAWATAATAFAIIVAVCSYNRISAHEGADAFPPHGKRNAIFMVSDGMGPTSLEMTRAFMQHVKDSRWNDTLNLDQHLLGSSRTRSSSSLITDSAAGATAFSCAFKSYNGAISVLPDGSPCGTVLEAAKLAGYKTGLVVTTRITDATPACFSAHVNMRSEEDRIAEQQLGDYPLGRMVDLMLGGGRCHFLPQTEEGGCRADDRNLVKEAQEKYGFKYISSRSDFDALKQGKKAELPLLGLFAPKDIPYDLDRRDEDYPSLEEMAEFAINALTEATRDSEKGFFLMVEGSRIDHAGHGNDPAAQVHEVLAYDKTFKRILNWVEENKAVLVATSDHETGGLAAARQLHESYPQYLWYPQVLANATHSSEYLGAQLAMFEGGKEDTLRFIKEEIVKDGMGITDATDEELLNIYNHKEFADYVIADMTSRRAQIGWSTHGHSAVDVNIYGSANAARLRGNHENTEIGQFLADYLELDLGKVTKILKEKGVGKLNGETVYEWMGRGLDEITREKDADENDEFKLEHFHVDHEDTYHGDFKRRVKRHVC